MTEPTRKRISTAFADEQAWDPMRLARESRISPLRSLHAMGPVAGMEPLRAIAFRVDPAVDYKRYAMLIEMQQRYNRALQTGASERMKNHYRYMLLAIHRALKVE